MWRRPKEWEGKRKELVLNGWKGGFEWQEFSFVNGWKSGFEWLEIALESGEICFGGWGDMVL